MLSPQTNYIQFWPNVADGPVHNTFFKHVLKDYQRPISIVSVFPLCVPDIDTSHIKISYSGEPYSLPTKSFDVNLIMEETDLSRKVICMPLFSLSAYVDNLWSKLFYPRAMHPKSKFCAITSSNKTATTRHVFMDRLSSYKKVDSMGAAHNTCGGFRLPKGEAGAVILRDYKFIICFENTMNKPCYLTEKLLMAYVHGAIPIYAGAAKALTWLNPAAFLFLEDGSPAAMDRLIEQVKALDQDDAAYAAMHAQPLLRDAQIPREMSIEHIRELVAKVVPS